MKPSGFTMSLGSKPGPQPPKKAPPAALSAPSGSRLSPDSDSDEPDHGKVHHVSAFTRTKGAISLDDDGGGDSGKKLPLVIPALGNKDWREESLKRKRHQVWLPPEARAGAQGAAAAEEGGSSETVGGNTGGGAEGYGLQVMGRKVVAAAEEGEGEGVEAGNGDARMGGAEQRTEDEIALEALVSGEAKKKSTLVLAPAGGNLGWRESRAQMSLQDEADAYKADIALRPDAPSLDAYDAVPVEDFGAALLRGMGWKEGMELGKGARGKKVAPGKMKAVERRPALLGLGAKTKEEALGAELGAWGKGEKVALGKKKGGWVDKTYVPVVLRNKVTGEIVDTPPLGKKGGDGRDREGNGEVKGREAELRERDRDRDGRAGSRRERGDGEDTDQSEKRRRREAERDKSRERRDYDSPRYSERERDAERDSWRDGRPGRDRGDRDRERDSGRDRNRDRDRRMDDDRGSDRRRDGRRRDDDRDRRRRSRERR